MATFHELVDFLKTLDAEKVEHTEGSYLGHCAAVYRDLKRWGASEELAQAGMFHSIYGTGLFQRFKLDVDRRDEVRALLGERAERLAYLNCAIVYDEFDKELMRGTPPFCMPDRLVGGTIEFTQQEFEDLCLIHLCDRLEQIPRSKHWDFRREAFRVMAERLGGVAKEAHDRVFAMAGTEG